MSKDPNNDELFRTYHTGLREVARRLEEIIDEARSGRRKIGWSNERELILIEWFTRLEDAIQRWRKENK